MDANTSPYLALWQHGHLLASERHLLAWAQAQRLLPLLLWRAQQAGWELPAAVVQAARAARYRVQAHHLLAEAQLRALGEVAQELRIPLVLVKGACVAHAYPETWLRSYNDIDLLIAEENLVVFLPLVFDLGYTWLEAATGQRGWHLPPLTPQSAGLKLEVHTALAREKGRDLFTCAQWSTGLRPFDPFPGLWIPDPVDHALYLIHHAVVHHALAMGLLHIVDLKFWTQAWGESEWQALETQARVLDLHRATGLALALAAWAWDTPWPAEVQQRFPVPPEAILTTTQRIVTGESVQKLPYVQRDLSERSLRGWIKYASLVLFGDPAVRQTLPRREKFRFYLHRPFQLLSNHGPTLWRLARGDRQTRDAWQVQQSLQTWLDDE